MPGLLLILAAYSIWGLFPLYFRQMSPVSVYDILAFRTLFTLISVLPMALFCGRGKEIAKQFRTPRNLGMLFTNGLLVSLNWLVFIILVNSGHTLQSSLGYYVNPLLTVCLALIFYREQFGKLQWASIGIASVGVLVFAIGIGTLPWGALAVATTFGLYGLMKKICPTDSLTSLTMETLLLMPFVITYIVYNDSLHTVWAIDPRQYLWLFGCGILTALTLLLYGAGALRVKLSTLGLCQYITPTGQFLVAVLIFREPMLSAQWCCFSLIWVALILFTMDSLRRPESKSTFKYTTKNH